MLKITTPDDWHVHLREGETLSHTVPATAFHFGRALVMPNLTTPLTSVEAIERYRTQIIKHIPTPLFTPYFTLFLNHNVSAKTLQIAKKTHFILGAKLYPQHATTHSSHGAKSIKALYPLIEVMQQEDLVLQIHGELPNVDIFDRETSFIHTTLPSLMADFPHLRIVLEHISTETAVRFIENTSENIAATITPHHLFYNRNDLLSGGIRPHRYCLPIIKRATDQKALCQAATSGNPKFFAGTDSAPHPIKNKESDCGCAGIYSAPYVVALYADIFERYHALERLDAFMGHFGAQFYRLPRNKSRLTLIRNPQRIPTNLPLGNQTVVPMQAGETLNWSVLDE